MAEFLITAPDGKKYKVTGATQEGALAALKKQLGQPSTQPQGPQYDSFGDLVKQRGQQAAQGATEVFAAVPEALAIAGAGNPNAGANVVAETVQKAKDDLAALEKDYQERLAAYKEAGREPPEELQRRYQEQQFQLRETIAGAVPGQGVGEYGTPSNQAYLDAVTNGGQVNLKPDAQDRELFKAGDALRQKSEDVFGKPQEGDTSFWGQVAQGLGNVAGMVATGPLGIFSGASMNSSQLYKEAKDAGVSEEDAKKAAALGGLVGTTEIIPINRALKLLPPRVREKVKSKFWKKLGDIAQSGAEEGLQEYIQQVAQNLIAQKIYDPERGWNEGASEAALVGAFVGGTVGTVGVAINNSLYKEDGSITPVEELPDYQAQAAADVARIIRQEAEQNGYNLKKVGASDESGSKKALEAAHEKISGQITAIANSPGVRQLLSPKQAKSLDQLLEDYAAAQTAIRQGKNKVKSKVTQENFDAIKRLLGPTKEGAELLNLLHQSNVLTDLFNKGLKGGISQFTDYFNPLETAGGAYDPSRTMNLLTSGAGAMTLGPMTTAGIVGGGRAIDAITGRRSTVDRFVRQFENKDGLAAPSGPSLIAAEQLRQQQEAEAAAQAEAEKAQNAERQKQLNLELTQRGAPATPESPQYTLEDATGLSRAGVAKILRVLKGSNKNPALLRAIAEYEQSVATGGRVSDLSPLIRAVRLFQQENPNYVEQVRPPNSLSNPQLLQQPGAAPGQPNVQTQGPAQPGVMSQSPAQPQFGPQATTQENYDRGVQSNRNAAELLSLQAQGDANLSVGEKAQIGQALTMLQENLGSNPVAAAQGIMEALQGKVSQEAIDTYVKPYVDRVMQQQASRQFMPTGEGPRGLAAAQAAGVAPTVETQAPVQPEIPQDLQEFADLGKEDGAKSRGVFTNTLEAKAKAIRENVGEEAAAIYEQSVKQATQPSTVADMNDIVRPIPPRPALSRQEEGVLNQAQDRLSMDFKDVTQRIPELQEGQRKLQANEITREDYEKLVNKYKPVIPYQTTPQPETKEDAIYALANGKGQSEAKAAKFGIPSQELKEGERVQFRLDIPSYSQHGTWVVSIHRPNSRPDSTAEGRFKAGPVVGYESVGRIKNADLGMLQASAQKIASGSPKGTIATMLGEYVPMTPDEAYQYVNEVLPMTLEPGSGYAQVGMDPERHAYFYDRNTMEPIVSAEDLVQIGPLVVAKNPVYAPKADFRYSMRPQEDKPQTPRGETTNIQMPNELGAVFEFAKNSNFAKGRDLKVALQEKSLAAQKEEGIDLSKLSEENVNRLADHVVADALFALQDNSNAIGWYDRTVTDALNTLSEIYPEIQTNPVNKLQFIWALAVTSNGTKVDKNFELAATAYDHLQRTGRFPTNIGIGEAARAINGGLEMYHTMMEKFDRKTNSSEGDHQLLADFMNSQVPVKEIEKDYGVKISGEGKNTLVRGASILGPKIGNGFFSNLYGNFDALTMDRWLMRSVGRMRGTLIKINQPMINQKNSEIKSLISGADAITLKSLRSYLKPSGIKIGKSMSKQDVNDLAAYIAKQSTSKEWRTGLNGISEDLRKAGNALAKYLDGQVEAPAGAKERDFIRAVFKQALNRLNSDPAITRVSNTGLTMSDLQALLWYPEKRLYDTAKAKEGEESKGYADDEAPDYANAARKLVQARSEMAGRGGLGSIGTNGPGGRTAGSANARPALTPIQDNVAGVLAQRIAGGSPRRTPVPSSQEVKQAAKPVRQALSIGLPGGEFENGIKDINQVHKLADAIGVVLKMTDNQDIIYKITGSQSALGVYDPNRQEAYALNPRQDVSEFQSYIVALHEVAHGVADMSGDNFNGLYGNYNKGDGTPYLNPMTGNADLARQNSFDDMVARMLIMYKHGLHLSTGRAAQAERQQIITEMRKLQDKGKYDNGSDVRYIGGAKSRDIQRRDTPYYKYIRNAQEFAVDPLIFYMHNPKRMKEEFPATAKMIRNFFKNSGKINFYSHPLAMAVAVVLASMMKADQEDEQERQQAAMMPPGALNQPMAPGMLSQA